MTPRRAALAALALALAAPRPARAHEASQEIERRGQAFAARVRIHGGAPLAGATFQVVRPGGGEVVREGKTPADGWVEVVPDGPGTWRVRFVDRTGHGKVVEVEVAEASGAAAGGTADGAMIPSTTTSTSTTTTTTTSTTGEGASPLEVFVGAAAILAVFVAAARLRRRRPGG